MPQLLGLQNRLVVVPLSRPSLRGLPPGKASALSRPHQEDPCVAPRPSLRGLLLLRPHALLCPLPPLNLP